MSVTLQVPATFYDDHVSRDCLPGSDVTCKANRVTVTLDAAAYDDLLSDAEFYSDASQFEGWDMRSLCASARRTVVALRKVGRPVG